jgi:hypothetical protein
MRYPGDADVPPHNQIQAASLARCFQLTADALTDALKAAHMPQSRIRTIALSHLDLKCWLPCAQDVQMDSNATLPPPMPKPFPAGRLQVRGQVLYVEPNLPK